MRFGMALLNVASCGEVTISKLKEYIENQNSPE
jgi:REP element-mobilizing transposase RayT